MIVKELSPSKGNPRNSEGDFILCKDGRILYVYTRYIGESSADNGFSGLAFLYSEDGGNSFGESEIRFLADENTEMNIMSVSLLRMGNGDIGLFYLVRKKWEDCRMVLRRSSDEGMTWSEPVYCMQREACYVVNNDRVLMLSNGRILIPAAYHYVEAEENDVKHFGPGQVCFYYSDDDGQTFQKAQSILNINVPYSNAGIQEPGAIELENGILWGWARSDLGRQFEFFSRDYGNTWSEPGLSGFTSPLSPLSMKFLPEIGKLMAVWNPIPLYQTMEFTDGTMGRTRLVYALGEKNGMQWSKPVILEDSKTAGYCYTSIFPVKDGVLLAYCAGDSKEDGVCLSKTRIRKVLYTEMNKLIEDTQH